MTRSLPSRLGCIMLASAFGTVPASAGGQAIIGYPPYGVEPRESCGKLGTEKETVRIKISQATLRERQVHKVKDAAIEADEDRSQTVLAQPNLTDPSLPLNYIASPDVDMSKDAGTRLEKQGDWAYLKISLGNNMRFIDRHALLVQDKATSTICEMEDPTQYVNRAGDKKNWFVRAKIRWTSPPVIMLYNVGVLVIGSGGTETPIFVDPKIKNTG